jgi:hypothetical protein
MTIGVFYNICERNNFIELVNYCTKPIDLIDLIYVSQDELNGLLLCCLRRQYAMIEYIIKSPYISKKLLYFTNIHGENILKLAIKHSDEILLNLILSVETIDINFFGNYIKDIIEQNQIYFFNILLISKRNMNNYLVNTCNNYNCLSYACVCNRYDMVIFICTTLPCHLLNLNNLLQILVEKHCATNIIEYILSRFELNIKLNLNLELINSPFTYLAEIYDIIKNSNRFDLAALDRQLDEIDNFYFDNNHLDDTFEFTDYIDDSDEDEEEEILDIFIEVDETFNIEIEINPKIISKIKEKADNYIMCCVCYSENPSISREVCTTCCESFCTECFDSLKYKNCPLCRSKLLYRSLLKRI